MRKRFSDLLLGKTIIKIERTIIQRNSFSGEYLFFYTKEGITYMMGKQQDCCANVYIDDICGDLNDLLDSPILVAEKFTNYSDPEEDTVSSTWTFYKLATPKGYVYIKWYGVSNGNYSEEVYVFNLEVQQVYSNNTFNHNESSNN